MKRIFSIIFLALFFSVGVFAQTASAVKINVTNVHGNTLSVAVAYYDINEDRWRTRGWYNVQPNSSRSFTFNNTDREVYLHSYMGNIKWGKGDITRHVISQAFDYMGDSDNCPNGKNRRIAKFTIYTIKNGVVNYKPTASN